jgi:hypothetical protein
MTNSEEIKFIEPKDINPLCGYWHFEGKPFKEAKTGDYPAMRGDDPRYELKFVDKSYLEKREPMEFTDKEVPSKMFTSFSDAPPEITESRGKAGVNIPMTPDVVDWALRESRRLLDAQESQTSPDYYTLPNGMQAREALQFFDYNTGCAIKYLWRHGKKEGEDPIKDLNKAKDYIDFRIEYIKKFGV